ncbi:ROK family protein [Pacificibacter sp.]|uniref:ROK family protein n=1 Tax=Pacificibacter sp. TaxID=1917866 RepID=UPI00321947C1
MDTLQLNRQHSVHAETLGCGPTFTSTRQHQTPLPRQVIDVVRAHGTIARGDVARKLDISPATMTSLSADLINNGFIAETELKRPQAQDSLRGRPPVGLTISGTAGYSIGIKISDQSNSAVILDFAGKKVGNLSQSVVQAQRSPNDIVRETRALIEAILRTTNLAISDVTAVAVGVPGMVDFTAGRVIWCPFMQETDVALRDLLQNALKLPVRIDNDANLLTLAELWFGAGRHRENFAVVSIEHGVGMGLVIDHELRRGGMGLGMELGHSKVQMDGALCRCGRRGCLEAYIADYALVREASTALKTAQISPDTHETLETLYAQAKAGDQVSKAIFSRAGKYLAMGLANVVTLFDPAAILLSGERLKFEYLYEENVIAEMHHLTFNEGRTPTPVEIHAWGDLIWAQGAAALALDHATDLLIS